MKPSKEFCKYCNEIEPCMILGNSLIELDADAQCRECAKRWMDKNCILKPKKRKGE